MPHYLTPSQQHALDLMPPRPLVRHEGAAETMQARTVWHVLRSHRWTILACMFGFGIAAAIYSLVTTPVYTVTASIRVDPRIQRVTDVLQSMQSTTPPDIALNDLATEMEMLQSRSLAQNVVDSLRPRRDPRRAAPRPPQRAADGDQDRPQR